MFHCDKRKKSYLPMTETAYYILLSLSEPRHGYGIIKYVEDLTNGRIKLGSGTVYGTLGKMSKDDLITVFEDQDRKTTYKITDAGKQLLQTEIERIKKLYKDTQTQEVLFKDEHDS